MELLVRRHNVADSDALCNEKREERYLRFSSTPRYSIAPRYCIYIYFLARSCPAIKYGGGSLQCKTNRTINPIPYTFTILPLDNI